MTQLTFPYYAPRRNRLQELRQGRIPPEYGGKCTVYLLHADKPIGNRRTPHGTAQHYVGIVRSMDAAKLQRRIKQHNRAKQSAKLTAAMKRKRRKLTVAMIWLGVSPTFEKYIKSWKRHREFCVCCQDLPFF